MTKASMNMIVTLGFYNKLQSHYAYSAESGKFNKELVQCTLATEQYSIYYDLVQYFPDYTFNLNDIKYLSIYLVEGKKHKINKFPDWTGKLRNDEDVQCLYSLHTLSLAAFLQKQLSANQPMDYLYFFYSIYYGYLQIFCTDIICKKDTKLNSSKVKLEGAERMKNASDFIQNSDFDETANLDVADYPFTVYMKSKLLVEQKQFDLAIEEYIFCFLETSECIIRALSLRDLSEICWKSNKYLLSLKALDYCYKLCDGYMLPSFTKQYTNRKMKMMAIWNAQNCTQCGSKCDAMKCCAGCMITPYCSKKCQKKHWNAQHRIQCKGNWQSIYKMFRDNISLIL